jgi:hypothetical protein
MSIYNKTLIEFMRKLLTLLLGILAFCTQILAQNRTITGRVTDEKDQLYPTLPSR